MDKQAKHTPEPWEIVGHYIVAEKEGTKIEIAKVEQYFFSDLEANARLIAAAPDLLTACEAFLEAWEKSLQLEKTGTARKLARAAVAKAKGR